MYKEGFSNSRSQVETWLKLYRTQLRTAILPDTLFVMIFHCPNSCRFHQIDQAIVTKAFDQADY